MDSDPTLQSMWIKEEQGDFKDRFYMTCNSPDNYNVESDNDKNGENIENDPRQWPVEQVQKWIKSIIDEYELQFVEISRFKMNGQDLCNLTLDDFFRLASPYNGDVIYAALLSALKKPSLPKLSLQDLSSTLMESDLNIDDRQYHLPNFNSLFSPYSSFENISKYHNIWMEKSFFQTRNYLLQDSEFKPPKNILENCGKTKLWRFLLELLANPHNADIIHWLRGDGEFMLKNPEEVARRWGERKNKPKMNYEKLGRALRYYYEKKIITKVYGRRYAYKFNLQMLFDSL